MNELRKFRHEARNALAIVEGNVQLIKEIATEEDELRPFIEEIEQAAAELEEVLDEVESASEKA